MDRQSVLVWVLLVIVGAILCVVGWYRFIAHAQEHGAWRDPSTHHVQFVTVEDDVRLEILDWGGRGRPMVLLAGSGNTAHVFDEFAPKLTNTCEETRRSAPRSRHSTARSCRTPNGRRRTSSEMCPRHALLTYLGGHFVFLTREAEVLEELRTLVAGLTQS